MTPESRAGCPERTLAFLRIDSLGPPTYLWVRRLFLGLLGVTYLAAFVSFWVQAEGLVGTRGIAPVADLLHEATSIAGSARFWKLPTVFWLGHSDAMLHVVCAVGVVASLLLTVGVAPRICAALAWLLYLSILSIGDIFLGYQWDILLVETGFLSIWLAPARLRPERAAREPVEPMALWLLRFLLFKLMFLSGAVKLLSGDPSWRNLTAMDFHHLTTPLPSLVSWWAYQLPHAFQALFVIGNFIVELGFPCLIFAPRALRWIGFVGFVGLQLAIGAAGNYGYFNLLSIALCVWMLDDAAFSRWLPARQSRARQSRADSSPASAVRRGWPPQRIVLAGCATLLALLSAQQLLGRLGIRALHFEPLTTIGRTLTPLRLTSAYGLFAVMTTERNEILLEGSTDGVDWKPYIFRYKPGPLERRPPIVGLHMPRIDWQMWFASLRGCGGSAWFHRFMVRLLEGESAVVGLLANDPFPAEPPRYLRSWFYRYRYAPAGSDDWWERELLGRFCPPGRLEHGRLVTRGVPRSESREPRPFEK